MPFGAALPIGVDLCDGEAAATFVVPAPNGCNLNCPFCAVRARKEAIIEDVFLTTDDYVCFLDSLVSEIHIGAVTLQGHEPLLPESWPCSTAILSAANRLRIPTALVTNGTFLADHITQLVALKIQGLTVSLDSGKAEYHDSSRCTQGAFAKVVNGLKAAVTGGLREKLIVTSVLQPNKSHYLDSIPELLSNLGVTEWVVSPLFAFRDSDIAGPVGDHDRIVTEMIRLQRIASGVGIKMLVDDEFGRIASSKGKVVHLGELRLHRMKRIEQILRLSPNGSFSVGNKVLRTVSHETPLWNPSKERAQDFVRHFFRKSSDPSIRFFLKSN